MSFEGLSPLDPLSGRDCEIVITCGPCRHGEYLRITAYLVLFAHCNGCIQFYLASSFEDASDGLGLPWTIREGLQYLPTSLQYTRTFYHATVQMLAVSEGP